MSGADSISEQFSMLKAENERLKDIVMLRALHRDTERAEVLELLEEIEWGDGDDGIFCPWCTKPSPMTHRPCAGRPCGWWCC